MGKLVSFASKAEDIAPLVKALQEVFHEHVAPGTSVVVAAGPGADVFLVYLFNYLVRARIRGFGSAVFEVGDTARPRPVTGLVRYPGTLTACDGKSVVDVLELVARDPARRGVSTRLGSVNAQYGFPRYGGGYFG